MVADSGRIIASHHIDPAPAVSRAPRCAFFLWENPHAMAQILWLLIETLGSLLAVSCGDNTVTLWKEELDGQWCQVSNVPLERS